MVCASVRGDNSRALADGLSTVQTKNHTLIWQLLIAPACTCTVCIARCRNIIETVCS